MTCDQAHELIFNEVANAALDEHLRGCAECTETSAVHARASALHVDSSGLIRPIELTEIRGRVGRRRIARAGFASAAALALLFVATRHSATPIKSESPPAPMEARLDVSQLEDEEDVAALVNEVDSFAHEDVATADPAYASFGPMASWFALPASTGCSAAQPLSMDCLDAPSEDFPE